MYAPLDWFCKGVGKSRKLVRCGACSALATLLLVANASGAIVIDLGVPNAALDPYPSPYATVTVDRTDSTHATITFQGLNPTGNYHYLLGDGSSVALNVNGSYSIQGDSNATDTIEGITAAQPADSFFQGSGPYKYSNSLPGNVSDFGSFSLILDSNDGAKNSSTSISFVLVNTSGSWASDNDVLIANDDGFFAASHIFVFNEDDYSETPFVTGFAANGEDPDPGPLLPEPTSIVAWLLGAGGLGFILRRRMKKAAA